MTMLGQRVPRWVVSIALLAGVAALVTMIVLPVTQIAADTREAGLGWSYVFLLVWRDLQAWLGRVEWQTVFGAVLVGGTVAIFWRMSRSETSSFDFADAFAGENGKTSMSKVGYFFGMMGGTWFLVSYTIAAKMTETYFGYYLTAFVAGKGITEIASVFRQAQIARTVEAGGVPDPAPAPITGRVQVDIPVTTAPAEVKADTPRAAAQPLRAGTIRPRGKHD